MGMTLGILVILVIIGYCLWRRLVQIQKRRGLVQRSVAMSNLSHLPILDRSIAERTWAKPSPSSMECAPATSLKDGAPTYIAIDMLRDLSQGV